MARTKAPGNRAVLYIRVSTDKQVDEGLSLETQLERLRAYCTMRGLTIVAEVQDPAQSAFKRLTARPGGRKVLDLLRTKQADAVVALKLDRVFRNVVDCLQTVETWDKQDIALHLVDMGGLAIDTSTATGKMFLVMMAGFAEFERNLTSERTKLALAHKYAKGEHRSGSDAPYGWAHDGEQLTPVGDEQEVIETAKALTLAGKSLRDVARELSRLGYRNRAGGHFAHVSVSTMLKGPSRLAASAA